VERRTSVERRRKRIEAQNSHVLLAPHHKSRFLIRVPSELNTTTSSSAHPTHDNPTLIFCSLPWLSLCCLTRTTLVRFTSGKPFRHVVTSSLQPSSALCRRRASSQMTQALSTLPPHWRCVPLYLSAYTRTNAPPSTFVHNFRTISLYAIFFSPRNVSLSPMWTIGVALHPARAFWH
jgi:hypothetical protein